VPSGLALELLETAGWEVLGVLKDDHHPIGHIFRQCMAGRRVGNAGENPEKEAEKSAASVKYLSVRSWPVSMRGVRELPALLPDFPIARLRIRVRKFCGYTLLTCNNRHL
jgi:hypothetical protein